MKNKKMKQVITGLIIGTNVLMLVACGSAKSADITTTESSTESMEQTYDTSMADTATPATMESAKAIESSQSIANTSSGQISGQKLIKDVNMSVETKEFDSFIADLNSQIASMGGYVQSSDVSGGSLEYKNFRYGNIVARIPADKLDSFVQIINDKGNVVHTSEMTTDVTLQYVDMESHIKALKIEQETLLSLLENAEKMEDVIAIQSQLTQVRYELESYESQIRTYDNLVNYSTVTINISEVERETNTEKPSFMNEIKVKLDNNLYAIKEGFRSFTINFIAALPLIVIWAIVIIILIMGVRKGFKIYNTKQSKIEEVNSSKNSKVEENKADDNEISNGK